MPSTAVISFDAQSDFADAFDGEQFGTDTGLWNFDSDGSTFSSGTGPGTNNISAFVYTETSGISQSNVDEAVDNGIVRFASIPNGINRMLNMRLCIQGAFADGAEGLQIQHRADAASEWLESGFIHGWQYDDYVAGASITDENGVVHICAEDGGWIDFVIPVDDAANQVRLVPAYVLMTGSTFQHDIAFRSFNWDFSPRATITGAGTPIRSHGRLGEATGRAHLPTRRGVGTPIRALGALGEATGFITSGTRIPQQYQYQTPLEIDLQYVASRLEREYAFADFWSPQLCPYYLLPYLAAWDAADLYYEGFGETYARATVESAPVINLYRWAERSWDEHTQNLGCIAVRSPVLSGTRAVSYEITVIPVEHPPENDADREYYRKSYEAITDLPVSSFTLLDNAFLSALSAHAMLEVITITPIYGDAE